MAWKVNIGLAGLSGLALILSFSPAEWHWLAFVALVPLMLAVSGKGKADFFLGWLTGFISFGGIIWWVTVAVINYGYLPVPVGWAVLGLMAAVLGLYTGLFAVLAGLAKRRGWSAGMGGVFFAAAAWTSLEWLRGHVGWASFPWATLAYSQFLFLPFIQSASLGGLYLPGFIIVAVNAGLAALMERRRVAAPLPAAVVPAVLLLLNLTYGSWRLSQTLPAGPPLKVAVLQGNIAQDVKWDPDYREATMKNYRELTLKASGEGAKLIIWPEAAAPFYYQREPAYRERLAELARGAGAPILFGSPGYVEDGSERRLRNRAYFLRPDGTVDGHYDKMNLVPFGEFVPWSDLLFFVDKLVAEVGVFTPGTEMTLFQVDGERFGTVICYEIIFPDQVRRFVGKGATFMTTITNDAWYGRSSASRQHFSQMVFRAVETGVPIARAANTGISGFVDARGRIILDSGLFVRGQYIAELRPARQNTFYVRHGDVFAWLCLLGTAAAVICLAVGKGVPGRRWKADPA